MDPNSPLVILITVSESYSRLDNGSAALKGVNFDMETAD